MRAGEEETEAANAEFWMRPPEITTPLSPLRGMLHKKHQHQHVVRNWGRRYFEVDDERGILYYFRTRSAQEWDEPARHFLLSSLVSVAPVDTTFTSHAIELTYITPIKPDAGDDHAGRSQSVESKPELSRLLLRASTESEQLQWVQGLQARIKLQRAASAYHSPLTPSPLLTPDERRMAPSSVAADAIASAISSRVRSLSAFVLFL